MIITNSINVLESKMRGLCTIILICILLFQSPANAFIFKKKDYPQIFLNNAYNAEKRKDIKSAFHSYEKALFYYKKDKKIIESYAKFCERQKFFDRAQELYKRLYVLTKDKQYLFKSNLCAIKNGKLTKVELDKIVNDKSLNEVRKNEFNKALIYHYVYKKDWNNVKKSCDKISKKEIGLDDITTCIEASEKFNNKKDTLGYYLRFYDFHEKDYDVINKILALAKELNDFETQEKFVKVLSALNPTNNGIKYKLAGIYEKQKNWQKAAQVYEELIASGDKSEHVKNSLAYVLSELNPKQQPIEKPQKFYPPKPLSGFKLAEKNFYEAWKEKNYESAQKYLSEMLKEQPNNKKLLKHRVDIDVSQENYTDAITYFERINTSSVTDTKFLAFLYSKTDNIAKALEIIENALNEKSKNKDLLNLALEYSMALKDWNKAILYTNQLLVYEPKSEKLLKNAGDLYATIKDFANAINAYERLVQHHPKLEYYMELANYYMANKDFAQAEFVLEPIYNASLNDSTLEKSKIIDAYLNSLLAQQKIMQAYCVIKTNHLENTQNGYMILGDIAMINRDYECAKVNYRNALTFEPESAILQNKLAQSYRMLKCLCVSTKIFNNVLAKDPCNLEARLGLGSIETDKKNFEKSRRIFCSILKENPDYRPAKIAIADSYIANDDNFAALETLDNMPQDEEVRLMKDQTRYRMGIRPVVFKAIPDMQGYQEMNVPLEDVSYKSEINPNRAINGAIYEDRKELEYKKRRNEAITLVPTYSIFTQQLADQFRLNYIKGGINLHKNIDGNKLVFMAYNAIVYSSGGPQYLNNFVNEFRGGIQARPKDKWEYRADIGVKAFQFGDGAMLITDSWLKHYFNDKFNLKVGVMRNNIEQSYLSAVGEPIDGIFTGRAADNKFYLEAQGKLPHQIYSFARAAYGVITAQNLNTNQYFEGYAGIGKLLYNNPKNKWINTFAFDVVSYNSAYQYNLLNIYSSTGALFGGYFSPSYFNATTGNVKLEGHFNKLPLRYGIRAFGGIQNALSPDQTTPTWGYSPYVSYAINDKISIYAAYNHFNFADIQRDQFTFSAVIRGFRRNAKN